MLRGLHPLRLSVRGMFPTRHGLSLLSAAVAPGQGLEGEGSPGGALSGTNGPSTGQLLKGREGRSPQRSCFNKRFFPEKGKAGGEGERDLFKAPLLLTVSVCLPGSLATPGWRCELGILLVTSPIQVPQPLCPKMGRGVSIPKEQGPLWGEQ